MSSGKGSFLPASDIQKDEHTISPLKTREVIFVLVHPVFITVFLQSLSPLTCNVGISGMTEFKEQGTVSRDSRPARNFRAL